MFDVADMMEKDSCASEAQRKLTVVDAFAIERMHLRVRPLLEHIDSTPTLEKSVLAGVPSNQINRLRKRTTAFGLIGETLRKGRTVYAKEINVLGLHISVSDIAKDRDMCAEACARAVDDDGRQFLVL